MKITIGVIGRAKAGPEEEILRLYLGRLPWNVELRELEVKKNLPEKKLKEQEAELLLSVVPDGALVVVLDEHGKTPGSELFSQKIQGWQEQARPLVFLIGGAAGHGEAVKKRADYTLSLGSMTWPHLLVRAMLAEQLYRAYTILQGHPYHKA